MIGPIAARVILAVFSTLFILLHVWPISSPPPHDVIILVATPPGPALITTPSPGPVWLRANTAPLAEKAFTTPAPIAEAATTAPLASTPAPIAEAATTAPLAELIKATGAAEAFTTPAPVAEAAVEASSADLAATRSTTPIFIYDTSEETTTTSERSPVQARMLASVAVALRGQEAQWTLHRLSSRTALRAALSDLDAADALRRPALRPGQTDVQRALRNSVTVPAWLQEQLRVIADARQGDALFKEGSNYVLLRSALSQRLWRVGAVRRPE
jgi:hypothetical protein